MKKTYDLSDYMAQDSVDIFSIDVKHQKNLDDGEIPDVLQKEFKKNNCKQLKSLHITNADKNGIKF